MQLFPERNSLFSSALKPRKHVGSPCPATRDGEKAMDDTCAEPCECQVTQFGRLAEHALANALFDAYEYKGP